MQDNQEVTHQDIYYKLGSIEAKVDTLIGHDDRIRSLETSRAKGRGFLAAVGVALTLVGAKLTNLI